MVALGELDGAGHRGRRMNAVVGGDELAVDPQLAAVVAGQVEAVGAGAVDLEEAVIFQRHVVIAACDAHIEAGCLAGCPRLELAEVRQILPATFVVAVTEIGDARLVEGHALQQVVGDLPGFLGAQERRHAARRPGHVRVFQEGAQAGNRVLGREVAERHGGGEQLFLLAGKVAGAVAGDAADLVEQIAAGGDELALRPFVLEFAGAREKVQQRFDILGLLRGGQSREDRGHRRAGLGRLGIGDETAQIAGPNAARHAVEHRGGLAEYDALPRRIYGMAAGAIQLAEQ